ncbi:MAG: Na+/H+ antiporter NhaC [Emcibacteraceae bacterium]|nr:Na+/H+ antiporter NhaC [Emcibacteraceae bacterium]MDG1858285.1 Na+/H+ antiporter NhaC [Emcibacteraceae bacterium]
MSEKTVREPSFIDALIPVISLVGMLSLSVYLYGDESSSGANQIALILSGCVALLVGAKNGHKWVDIEAAIKQGIANTYGAILILMTVGMLVGSWILSGTVPAMIYYGLQIINPTVFYFTACILSAITAISIGSSWTVASTIGIGLMGIAGGLGLAPEITAGAIISGAYFGDKMSPLSDTTNLAPAVAGTDLFTHIRHMTWTTFPSIGIAVTLYLIIGLTSDINSDNIDLSAQLNLIEQNFDIGIYLMIPLVVVFFLAIKKNPAFPSLVIGTLTALLVAVIFQQDVIMKFAGATERNDFIVIIDGIWQALFSGYVADTGDSTMNELLSQGGMASMMNTIWLVMCAITFGAILEKLGLLRRLVIGLLGMAKTTGSLIVVTALTCIGINILAADQYIAIVLPGRMYRLEFKKRNLAAKNLSRALEDTGTVTSVLVPWNTCGAFFASTLGVATFAYAPYCFFNIASPIVSVLYGLFNVKISPINPDEVMAE